MKYLYTLVILIAILCSCTESTPPIPAKKYDSVKVALLVAPWCEPCNKELPQFEAFSKESEKIFVEAVVQTGKTVNSDPSDEISREMKKVSGVSYPVEADSARWNLYNKYTSNPYKSLPVSVVIGEMEACIENTCQIVEEVVRVFNYAAQPLEVMAVARAALK